MNLENIRRDDWILGGLALLLLIDLLFFPWFSASFGPLTATTTATGSLDGWTAIIAVLLLAALIADLAIERLSPTTTLPAIGNSRIMTRFVLAVVAAAFIALKFLLHIHFSGFYSFSWGFYIAIILTIALVYFADQARRAPVAPVAPPPPPPVGSAGPPPPSGPAAP
jgi:hypothetical protein